jgi:mRNA-degrading endonuclease HigB of HigAB toxin-antitoxin module
MKIYVSRGDLIITRKHIEDALSVLQRHPSAHQSLMEAKSRLDKVLYKAPQSLEERISELE